MTSKNRSATYPTINEVSIPAAMMPIGIVVSPISLILSATAPRMAGTERRKEYSAAVFAGIPKNNPS